MPDVTVLLPAPSTGSDPWIHGAADATESLRGDGLRVELRIGVPPALPESGVTICHGVQYAALLENGATRPVIVSDLLPTRAAGPVTTINWCWAESASQAARYAVESGARRLGFVAGPPVPTQRRVLAAFTDAAGSGVTAVHLPSFDDVAAGRAAAELLVERFGCDLIAHSADAGGVAATVAARAAGVPTLGFLVPEAGDAGWIHSDIAGVLAALARRSLAGGQLEPLFVADAASGFGGFRRSESEPREISPT